MGRVGERLRACSRYLRPTALLVVALAGVAIFLKQMNAHYPVSKWLVWTYAEAWLCALTFGAASLCAGDLLTVRVLRPIPPLRERLLVSLALGVFVFFSGVFVVGLLDGLGPVFFFAWPLGLIAVGIVPLVRTLRRAAALVPHARRVAMRPSWWGGLVLVFGLAGVALLYVNILSPANVAYDSRWYHLALAEHYAAAGAVTRFPEGWFCSTYPHFASYLYTWALLIPAANLVTKIEIAAHIEFVLFAATLAGVGLLVRWCTAAANIRVRNGWAAVFLFPGILLYDSTLSVAADHVLAFFAPPFFLLVRRTLRQWRIRPAVLVGLLAAAAAMTKYQAVSLIVVPAVLFTLKAGRLHMLQLRPRTRRGVIRAWAVPVSIAVAGLLFSTPLWLKNWIWYGDPLYPMLRDFFTVRPWVPGADPGLLLQVGNWTPKGNLWERVKETAIATVTFSFIAHDWSNLHGTLPIFGSLFTLTLPLLAFVRGRRRVLGLGSLTMAGIAIWYWTYHQDRYLQALVPWMAAVTAAILALVWNRGTTGRIAVAALVTVQVLWGGDVYTIPTHSMIGTQPARAALDLVSSGYRKDWAARSNSHMEYAPVAPLLPKGAKLLVHERMIHFGHGAESLIDMPGTQAGISYSQLGSPRDIHHKLREFGATHILWSRGVTQNFQGLVDDLLFFEYVEKYTVNQTEVAGFVLGTMPFDSPPEQPMPRRARVQRCDGVRTVRLSQVDAAIAGAPVPETVGAGPPAFYVVQSGCAAMPAESAGQYRLLLNRAGFDLFALKAP